MKRLPKILALTVLLIACNDEKKADESSAAGTAEKKETAAVSYPYKAGYSSDFSIGDANHSKLVLDLYKMWEDNKLDDMKSILADSVGLDFPDGNKFNGPVDSFINMAKQFRSTLSSVKVSFDGWMPVHSNDMKDDYVLVWSHDYNTDKSGKMDSTRGHAYFLIKNNKIRSWSEFQQKLTPPPPPPPAKK